MNIPNKVQLITYADSMGGNLRALKDNLDNHFSAMFSVLHILPPFPSSGDRGFAPITYTEIEKTFGTWDDMDALGKKYIILVDVMVNHISKYSVQFQDFLKHGRDSVYADYFITLDKLWADGEPNQHDLDKIYLRRPKPFSEYQTANGNTERVWTTFGMEDPSEQIDLDVHSENVLNMIEETFKFFSQHGIGLVRLDAVGYVIKKMGTSCFLVEPEFGQFLHWIKNSAAKHNVQLLCEVHADINIQKQIAKDGFWIYDFVLPYAVLETLLLKNSGLLYHILKDRPHNQFTTLDCHDGVPVKPDLDGITNFDKVKQVCAICEERGSHFTRVVSEEHKDADGFDVHQICGTYYSMLNDDDAYIAARAIQFFVPGIPQVYYAGLFAAENDEERRLKTGDNREANRHNFTNDEIDEVVKKSIVKRLCNLIRFRNNHIAFGGNFIARENNSNEVDFLWEKGSEYCNLHIDLSTSMGVITYTENGKFESLEI
ncbi:MAG: sucrose phosphorylase [Treponema sp.]|jgi:sucrose phosphorylase|nr:sucrose phosphorylase [Treponema sp.]